MQVQSQYENPAVVPAYVTLPDLSDMPAEISYFFILPKDDYSNQINIRPDVLTYKDNPTLQQLMAKYRAETNYSPPAAKHYLFSLISSVHLNPTFTIKDLKKLLARDSLDGIFLFVQYSTDPSDEEEYIDECCVTDYFGDEKQYGRKRKFLVRFEITMDGCPNTEVLYLSCEPSESGNSMLGRLLVELTNQFGLKNLAPERIIDVAYTVEGGKEPVKLLRNHRLALQKLYNESTVTVRLANPKKQALKRINAPKYNSWMVIYKENETEPIRVKYDDIANMTVSDLYRKCLQLKESERKKDAVYCLKIMDRILRPTERINSAEIYFQNNDANKPLNVVAKVVNEKMIFYKAIPAIAKEKKAEFKLDQITIPPNEKNRREECERTIRLRAEKAPQAYFKITDNVGPIVIYTSELRYLDKDTKHEEIIYASLNKFLRETPILSLQEKNFQKEWRLRYASTLLKHLNKTKIYEGDTWRGITYDPALTQKDVGSILTFKQFTSTSKYQNTAVSFAKKYSAKEPFHLFAFKVKTGRSVIEYSLYGEGQILLEPYTQFQLLKVEETKFEGKRFKVYSMEERVTSKLLPGIMANFIVWIDDKPKEGKAIFEKIILPEETTIFEQLQSTAELSRWLNRHARLFTDASANVLFVTNMTRKEEKGLNEQAGIEGVRLIRQVSKTVPIFFYIGNIEANRKKLTDSKVSLDRILIGNQPAQVEAFLSTNIAASV